uniref:Uncharacterized protein n=1 Tax=Arundo donax TaxID=35708 RepID=A0A0A9GLT4_ARUDO
MILLQVLVKSASARHVWVILPALEENVTRPRLELQDLLPTPRARHKWKTTRPNPVLRPTLRRASSRAPLRHSGGGSVSCGSRRRRRLLQRPAAVFPCGCVPLRRRVYSGGCS